MLALVVLADSDNLRRANTSTRDNKVIAVGHASHSFDDLAFVISDNLDATKIDSQREAPFGEVGLNSQMLIELEIGWC